MSPRTYLDDPINPLSLRPNRGRVLASFALLAATFTAAADCTAQDKVVVRAGRAITLAGPDIENAVVMIENGVITQIGKADDIEIPWDAQVVDGIRRCGHANMGARTHQWRHARRQ